VKSFWLPITALFSLPSLCGSVFLARRFAERCEDEGTRLPGCDNGFESEFLLLSIALFILFTWSLNKLISKRKPD
jgi:hypothetical protein